MQTTDIDPLIPRHETSDETLTRLSANLGTLTGLMNDAERIGDYYLASLFNRARDAKVAWAEEIIARVTAGSGKLAGDRRFLLVRGAASAGVVPVLPRQKFQRSTGHLALTQ